MSDGLVRWFIAASVGDMSYLQAHSHLAGSQSALGETAAYLAIRHHKITLQMMRILQSELLIKVHGESLLAYACVFNSPKDVVDFLYRATPESHYHSKTRRMLTDKYPDLLRISTLSLAPETSARPCTTYEKSSGSALQNYGTARLATAAIMLLSIAAFPVVMNAIRNQLVCPGLPVLTPIVGKLVGHFHDTLGTESIRHTASIFGVSAPCPSHALCADGTVTDCIHGFVRAEHLIPSYSSRLALQLSNLIRLIPNRVYVMYGADGDSGFEDSFCQRSLPVLRIRYQCVPDKDIDRHVTFFIDELRTEIQRTRGTSICSAYAFTNFVFGRGAFNRKVESVIQKSFGLDPTEQNQNRLFSKRTFLCPTGKGPTMQLIETKTFTRYVQKKNLRQIKVLPLKYLSSDIQDNITVLHAADDVLRKVGMLLSLGNIYHNKYHQSLQVRYNATLKNSTLYVTIDKLLQRSPSSSIFIEAQNEQEFNTHIGPYIEVVLSNMVLYTNDFPIFSTGCTIVGILRVIITFIIALGYVTLRIMIPHALKRRAIQHLKLCSKTTSNEKDSLPTVVNEILIRDELLALWPLPLRLLLWKMTRTELQKDSRVTWVSPHQLRWAGF